MPVSGPAIHGIDEASFPGVNSWFLSFVNPDGTGLENVLGISPRSAANAGLPAQSTPERDGDCAVHSAHTPSRHAGRKWAEALPARPLIPTALGGPQQFGGFFTEGTPFPELHFAGASALQDGRILLTAANIGQGQAYGVYILDSVAEMRMRVISYFNAGSSVPLNPVALEPRALPPVVEDRTTNV